jgi:phosphoribosylanthranilate isomerase
VTAVKICGIRTEQHARAAVRAGASMIGLVLATSRRRVRPHEATALSRAAKAAGRVSTVGVFVNESVDRMNEFVHECGLDYVQLSGDEPDDVIPQIDALVIRVVHVNADADRQALGETIDRCPADLVLLDTAAPGVYGGTGRAFDWSLIPPTQKPVLVAGGLTVENVGDAIRAARPWGVDVSGGVETDGVKDSGKIAEFIQAVRRVG